MVAHELAVVVATHNAEEFLPVSLESMRRSARDGIQWVVVDDASTDESPDLLERAEKKIPGLCVIRSERNIGVAAARNLAHSQVDAHYLTYMDADDWLGPGHLERLLGAIEEHDVDFVRCDHTVVKGSKREVARVPETQRNMPLPTAGAFGFMGGRSPLTYLYLWAGIYDLSRLDLGAMRFDESLRTASDRPWVWNLYLTATSTAVVSENSYFYRKSANPKALTQAGNTHTLDFLFASTRILEAAIRSGNDQAIDRAVYSSLFLVDYHLERDKRLSRPLRQELRNRASAHLAELPQEQLHRALEVFPARSSRKLKRVVRRAKEGEYGVVDSV